MNTTKNNIMDKIIKDIEAKKFAARDTISDLQIYKTENVTYGLPINSSPKLRQYFHAAVLSYIQNTEFKEVIEHQTDIKNFSDEKYLDKYLLLSFLIVTEIDFQHNVLYDFVKCLESSDSNLNIGEINFLCTLLRLRDSFKSIFVLRNHGLYIEMYPLMRLIYEQLCWACFSIDQTKKEELERAIPTRTVKYLKSKIKESYGKLYKMLSDMAHMLPKSINPYWDINDDYNAISIHGRSESRANEELPNVLALFHIYLEVFQYGLDHFSCLMSISKYDYYKDLINVSFFAIKQYMTCYETDDLSLIIENTFERL